MKLQVVALFAAAIVGAALPASCIAPVQEESTHPRAAIVDQLGSTYPNERFVQDLTQALESRGFEVTHFTGSEVDVELYQALASYGFRLIIFRTHSTVLRGDKPLTGRTYLFTNEPYDMSGYVAHQLAEEIRASNVEEGDPLYYSIGADFISRHSKGRFDDAVIVAMGCASLYSVDMAEAFVGRGATVYAGWNGKTRLDFVDDFTAALVTNLCSTDMTIKKALYTTAADKGAEPTHGSVLNYYPADFENTTLVS
jgi:hypothetical protein